MVFNLTNFTINGNTIKYMDGTRRESFVPGSVKQWDGSFWNRIPIPGKAKERRITFSGNIDNDADKTNLENLRTNTVFTDFTDGVVTLSNAIVIELVISHRVSGPDLWDYRIVIEEFIQT